MSTVTDLLKQYGPLSSSKVKQLLMRDGLTDEAARQHIHRAKSETRRLTTIKLPKRANFLYLDDQYGSADFFNSLIKAHTEVNSAFGIAIQGIMGRGGMIPLDHFKIASGAPTKLKKHLGREHILKKLIDTQLLKKTEIPELGTWVQLDGKGHLFHNDHKTVRITQLVEKILIKGVKNWLRKNVFVSYGSVKTRLDEKIPVFGQFGFDLAAPSYIQPLVKKKREKAIPGFVVADVIYNDHLNADHIKYFLRKCQINRQFSKMKPFIAFLMAARFKEDAFRIGREQGLIFTTPENLFGEEIAKALRELVDTLNHAAAVAASNPDNISKLFNSLSKIEGASINLKGALLELIVGHLVHEREGNTIDIGVEVADQQGRSAEIDIRRVKGDYEVGIYECKSRPSESEIDKDDVEIWLESKVPIIKNALRKESRFNNSKMIFEYWTSAKFSEDAVSYLEAKKELINKYEIKWRDGQGILKYARKIKTSSIVNTFKEQYLNII